MSAIGDDEDNSEQSFKGVDESAEEHYGKIVKDIRLPELRWADVKFIRRILMTKEGKVFSEYSARKDFEHLDKLRIFSYIRLNPFDDDGEVDYHVDVKETYRWFPTVSVGLTDANGISAGVGFKALNMFNQAVKWTADVRGGGATKVSTAITNPWVLGVPISFTTGLGYQERLNEQFVFDETTFKWKGIFGKTFTDHWTAALETDLLFLESDVDGKTLDPDNQDELFTLGGLLVYDDLDSWTNPTEGFRFETRALKTGGFLPGDGDWWNFIFDARKYFKIKEKTSLLLAGYFQYQTGEIGKDIPEYMQFNFGGANSIRGWSQSSRFGKSQLIGTSEWLFTLIEPKDFNLFGKFNGYLGLQAALFADAGILWNDSDEFNSDDVIGGLGISIRPLLPFIQYLRFEFAYGEPGGGVSFFLGAGNRLNKLKNRVR